MPSTVRTVIFCALLPSCVRGVGDGPQLGACADPPDGAYTFGEAGIGTCLSGPVDMAFHTAGGSSVLAVVNADPFRAFASGSLTLIDTESLLSARGTVTVDSLAPRALPLDRFGGRLAFTPDGRTALVPTRQSEGSYFRRTPDRVWLVDLTDPAGPRFADRALVGVGADPYALSVDRVQDRAFVVNATEASISVIDLQGTPEPLPVAGTSRLTTPRFDPLPSSRGRAELVGEVIEDLRITRTDAWTATWLDGTWRGWVPTENGLAQWTGNGRGPWRASARGVEIDADLTTLVSEVSDPWLTADGGRYVMWFTDGGTLRAAFTDGSFGSWAFDVGDPLPSGTGWRTLVGGPTFTGNGDTTLLYFDGRETEEGPSAIGLATSTDAVTFKAGEDPVVFAPEGWDSIEQPAALRDPHTGAYRLWATVRTGASSAIVHTASTNAGTDFEPVEVVLSLPGAQVGAPVVAWTGGRYLMWLSVGDAAGWSHAWSSSADGLTWTDPEILAPSERPPGGRAPRAAVQPAAVESWQLAGADGGIISPQITAGGQFASTSRGFLLRAASGHDSGTDIGPDLEIGVRPGSLATPGGLRTLYVTGTDRFGRDRLLALRRLADRWVVAADDLIPMGAGGNVDGAREPVVFARGGQWMMVYAAGRGGVWRLRRASSEDGLVWNPIEGEALPEAPSFESVEQLAHSVVAEEGGWRLFYAGGDGGRTRIGEATSTDGISWTRLPGLEGAWTLPQGEPGSFDDSSVRDPAVVRTGDVWRMWYAGYDGESWSIGLAERVGSGPWVRRVAPASGVPAPSLSAVERTFSAKGVAGPVVDASDPASPSLWYGGWDGFAWRIGEAVLDGTRAYPAHRFPSPGDRFTFDTLRGQPGRSTIQLGQVVQNLVLPGVQGTNLSEGPTSVALDEARGLLFVGSKDFPGLIVVDVRDDSTPTFSDRNVFDIEAVMRFETTTGALGVQAQLLASDGLLYLATREPDGVLVVDPQAVADDAEKDIVDRSALGVIPMRDLNDDAGNETFAGVGVSALAEVPGTSLLLATQMRDNSLVVIDRSLGAFGEEVLRLDNLVEAPVSVRISPDGSKAVVAGYIGGSGSTAEGSSLVVVDLATFEVLARVVNR